MDKLFTFGPWALITDALSDIGKVFASRLASSGFNLVLVAQNPLALNTLSKHYQETCGIKTRILAVAPDGHNYLEAIEQKTADLDIGLLVSNADSAATQIDRNNKPGALKSLLKFNVIAQVKLTHAFANRFGQRKQPSGILILNSDTTTSEPLVMRLGESLNDQFKHQAVNVSVLTPGVTDTPGITSKETHFNKARGMVMSTEDVVDEGFKALLKNKPSHIAGWRNRLWAAISSALFFVTNARSCPGI